MASRAARTTASGSSPLTCRIGIGSRLQTSEANLPLCRACGSAVKPMRLLTTTCTVPPTEKPSMSARLRVSAAIPWPARAASPCMTMGKTACPWSSPRRACLARTRPMATGSTASRWLGFDTRWILTSLPPRAANAPVAPRWYLTSPPPRMLRGSTSSKPANSSTGSRPTTCAMTLSRPRWAIARTAIRARRSPASCSISVSSGMSASMPSMENRLLPM